MNIVLIGHGKMGKEVESVAAERGAKILRVLNSNNNIGSMGITDHALADADVCIDFSHPGVVVDNIKAVAGCGKSMVVGTTGWHDHLDVVKALVEKHKIGLVHAANFSLGVNLFMQIVHDASRLIDKYPEYDVALNETHHAGKVDSPSGTALALGSIILQTIRRKQQLLTHPAQEPVKSEQLHITSSRMGHVTGTHQILFDSESDSLTLIHTAKNRRGFALGALLAAEWLKGRKGMFTMRDVILG
ncbi:MAG TPA: 4-hydroxy-tetrahydrodipicolinate reductase [Bacteroidota bacterium]